MVTIANHFTRPARFPNWVSLEETHPWWLSDKDSMNLERIQNMPQLPSTISVFLHLGAFKWVHGSHRSFHMREPVCFALAVMKHLGLQSSCALDWLLLQWHCFMCASPYRWLYCCRSSRRVLDHLRVVPLHQRDNFSAERLASQNGSAAIDDAS
eukprot:5412267-Amphidinium_carterae.1